MPRLRNATVPNTINATAAALALHKAWNRQWAALRVRVKPAFIKDKPAGASAAIANANVTRKTASAVPKAL